jgi:phosphoglucomutase
MGLLAAEMTARLGKDPSRIYTDVTSDLGISFYERIDAPASSAQKSVFKNLSPERVAAKELAGEAIEAKLTKAPGNDRSIGGIKVVAKSGWFAARPSGTEDIYKIYAESFRSKDHLQQIQRDAQTIIDSLVEKL